MAAIGDVFKPGQIVEASGIYTVTHDVYHRDVHEVTCVRGKPFPPCNHCGHHVRFKLKYAAHHIDTHEHFKK
jgi:hypothetical protein